MWRIRKQAREAEQRSQWRFLLRVSAAVTNIFSPARDQWISFCVLACSGRQRTNNNNYKKSAPIRHVAACRVEHAASSRGIFYVSFHFTTFDNLFPRGRARDSTWQAAGNNTNHLQPRNNNNSNNKPHDTNQHISFSLLRKELGH